MDKDNVGNVINDMLNGPPVSNSGNAAPEDFLFGLSMGGFLAGSFFSLLGLAFFTYGRKQGRLTVGTAGVILMIYPLFISETWQICAVGIAVSTLPWILSRFGIDL